MGLHSHILAGTGGAALAVLTILSAPAQDASPYTMPTDTASDSRPGGANATDLIAAPSHQDFANSPVSLSAPPPPPNQANARNQAGKQAKTWVEMTPEEILGIDRVKKQSAPAKSFNPNSKDPTSSPLHDFLMQQRGLAAGTQKPGTPGDNSTPLDGGFPGANHNQRGNSFADSNSGALLSHLLESSRAGFSPQNADSPWAGAFQAPALPPPTPAQQASMTAFREMLNPSLVPDIEKSSSPGSRTAAVTPLDSNVEPPSGKYNPHGATFTPLDAGIGRPKRLDALPAATAGYLVPFTAPSWAPQPPPWKVTAPQLFVAPQRHF